MDSLCSRWLGVLLHQQGSANSSLVAVGLSFFSCRSFVEFSFFSLDRMYLFLIQSRMKICRY